MRESLAQGSAILSPLGSSSCPPSDVFSPPPHLPTFRPSNLHTLFVTRGRKLLSLNALRTLILSCRSFPLAIPLFSIACALFCHNTHGSGTTATAPLPLRLSVITHVCFYLPFVCMLSQIPFLSTPFVVQ